MLCKVSGFVKGYSGAISYGVISVYLRAPVMPKALFFEYQEPVSRVLIDKEGYTEFYLTPNTDVESSTGLDRTNYEIVFENQYGAWFEEVVITPNMLLIDINDFVARQETLDPVNRMNKHSADVFNPHLTTISQVLQAEPAFKIPLDRVDINPDEIGLCFQEKKINLILDSDLLLNEFTPGVIKIELPLKVSTSPSFSFLMDGREQVIGNGWDLDSEKANLLIYIPTSSDQRFRQRYISSKPEYIFKWLEVYGVGIA